MAVADEIRGRLAQEGGKVDGKRDSGNARFIVAQQKSFLSKKTVEYSVKFKVDEAERVVRFFEMLKESGSGMSGGDPGDVGGGWSFSKETYKTGRGGREGTIAEQGALLGKKYAFAFDYSRVRAQIESIASQHGYRFEYQITPKGL